MVNLNMKFSKNRIKKFKTMSIAIWNKMYFWKLQVKPQICKQEQQDQNITNKNSQSENNRKRTNTVL